MIDGNDVQPDSIMDELSYDWFSGLSPEQRDILIHIAEEEEERRSKVRKPAASWLALVVGSDENSGRLLKRLSYFSVPAPALGDFPNFRVTLAYALASNTLTSDEFVAYTTTMGYRYWEKEQDLLDIVALTNVLWSLPSPALSSIMPEWYKHILRNAPFEGEGKDTQQADVDNGEKATFFLEKITAGKLRVAQVDGLDPLPGILFTGPRVSIMVVDSQEQGETQVVSHLLAYFLLGHIEEGRFQMWIDKELPAEVEDAVRCLEQSTASGQDLSPQGRKLVRPFLEIGVPSETVRMLFEWRANGSVSIISLLQRRVDERGGVGSESGQEVHGTKLEPGELVFGSDKRIYLIDEHLRRREVCSEEMLDNCVGGVYVCKGTYIRSVPDETLLQLERGAPILNPDEAERIGLCQDCSLDLNREPIGEERKDEGNLVQ